MLSNRTQAWQMDINEVERIKVGVLKYITVNQAPKPKERNSSLTNEAKTPFRNLSPKLSKKSSIIEENNKTPKKARIAPSKNKIKQRKQKNIRNMKGQFKMPQGYFIQSTGKIEMINKKQNLHESPLNNSAKEISMSQQLFQKQTKFENIQLKQSIKIQNFFQDDVNKISQKTINNIPKLTLNSPLQSIDEEQQHSNTVQVPRFSLLAQQKQVAKKQLSVFQIAKRFGGSNANSNNNVVNINKKAQSNKDSPNKIQINKSLQKNSDNFSVVSFGNKQQIVLPSKKNTISQFLGINKSNNYVAQTKQQQKMPQKKLLTSKQQSESEINKFSSPNKTQKKVYDTQNKVNNKKFQIKFTQEQEEQLKLKYKVLSQKLDILKRKVLDQSRLSIGNHHSVSNQKMIKTQATLLYRKYSPLKMFNNKREQSKFLQEQSISQQKRKNDYSDYQQFMHYKYHNKR